MHVPAHEQVLIVGAGPVGLAMATELLRQGIRCRIIDRKNEPSIHSKALGITPRTLEAFDRWGVIDDFLAEGNRIRALNVYTGAEQLARVTLEELDTPYPFMLALPQSQTEQMLIRHLADHHIAVDWNHQLVRFEQSSDAVAAQIEHVGGGAQHIDTDWLIGCDGAHSQVRHQLGLQFRGTAYPDNFLLADAQLQTNLNPHEVHAFFHHDGALALIPLGQHHWRIIVAVMPAAADSSQEPTLDDVQAFVDQRGPGNLRLSSPQWISRFGISRRHVTQHRDRRVFLAGDAAHICSPVGGQGMNMGIQDAANLGWKLPLVISHVAADELLDSYSLEREPVAADILQWTDRLTSVVTAENPFVQQARNFAFSLLSHVAPLEQRLAMSLAELDIHYRDSVITMDDLSRGGMRTRHTHLGAGDRAPDGNLHWNDDPSSRVRIFELLRDPRHVLLLFHGRQQRIVSHETTELEAVRSVRRLIDEQFADNILLREIVTPTDNILETAMLRYLVDEGMVYDRYGVTDAACFLIRPDGYIGYHGSPPDPARVGEFIRGIIRSQSASERREQQLHGHYVMGEGF